MDRNRCTLSKGRRQLPRDSTTSDSSHQPRRQTRKNPGVQSQSDKPHHLMDEADVVEVAGAGEEEDVVVAAVTEVQRP